MGKEEEGEDEEDTLVAREGEEILTAAGVKQDTFRMGEEGAEGPIGRGARQARFIASYWKSLLFILGTFSRVL